MPWVSQKPVEPNTNFIIHRPSQGKSVRSVDKIVFPEEELTWETVYKVTFDGDTPMTLYVQDFNDFKIRDSKRTTLYKLISCNPEVVDVWDDITEIGETGEYGNVSYIRILGVDGKRYNIGKCKRKMTITGIVCTGDIESRVEYDEEGDIVDRRLRVVYIGKFHGGLVNRERILRILDDMKVERELERKRERERG